jgi:hypothetical protein
MNTRSFKALLPSSSINCLTFWAAASVKTNDCGISAAGALMAYLQFVTALARYYPFS